MTILADRGFGDHKRARLPGHQGPALRDGDGRDPHADPERRDRLLLISAIRDGAADHTRDGGREPGDGPAAQVQHIKDVHTLAVPPGVHALRTDPEHARASAARRFAEMLVSSGLLAGFCRDQMRGGVRMPSTPHIRETDQNYLTPVNASSR